MANWELELLAGIYGAENPSEAFRVALDNGTSIHQLGSQEARVYWSYIHSHYTRPHNFGYVPSLHALTETFPMMELPRATENLLDLTLRVKQGHVRRKTDRLIEEYTAEQSEDPIAASANLQAALAELNASQTAMKDVSFKERAWLEILADLNALSENDGVTGMPWPWEVMNRATGGIQPGDMIMFWALPKAKKTWTGLYISAFLFQLGYRVLVYSKEMMWPNIRRRLSCIIGRVDYARFKANALTRSEQFRYLSANRLVSDPDRADFRGELIFTDCDRADGAPGGPIEVRQKVDIYRPDFVFLDSSYLLQVPGVTDALDWKSVGAITRQVKQVAKTTGVPMLGIFQENEKSAYKYKGTRGTASIAMYAGIVMDCDVGIKIVANPRLEELSFHFAACRETPFPGFTIKALLAENFDFAHLNLHELEDADSDRERQDSPEPDNSQVQSQPTFSSRYSAPAEAYDDVSNDLTPE